MAKKKPKKTEEKPKVNPELEGFDIEINPFGEIKSNFNIDRINEFLNAHVDDKKLRDRKDLKKNKKKKTESDDSEE